MKNKLLLLTIISLLIVSISIAASKSNNYGSVVISEVLSVYDGDTFRCNIPNYPPLVGDNMPIRILGIDCPEMRGSGKEGKLLAIKAKEFTSDWLNKAKVIKLKNMQRGKYFRILADVEVDGVDLGSLLIKEGLAKVYDGGKKSDWEPTKVAPTRGSPVNAEYVASKSSEVFHIAECSHAGRISVSNLIEFGSKDEALKSGRRGCKKCTP